jgi:regulatory subunit for Cdc7p protein kinase
MMDNGVQRHPLKSRSTTAVKQVYKPSEKEVENVRQWQDQTRSRFPKMVFYFESIPAEQRVKLAKQVTGLGAVSDSFIVQAIENVHG